MGANIPLPALDVKPPEPQDPLAGIKQALAIKGAQQQQQMGGLQIQQAQQQQQDRQNTIQALKDSGGDPDKYLENLRKSGVSNYFQQQQGLLEMKQKAATLTLDQHKIADENNDWLDGKIQALKSTPDPNARQGLYQQTIQEAQRKGISVGQLPPQAPDNDALDQFDMSLKLGSKVRQQAAQEAEETKNKNIAALDQNKLDIAANYKKNPQLLLNEANQAAPFNKYPDLNKRTNFAVQQAMQAGDVEGAKAAIAKAQEEVGGVEKETNPQVQAGKVKVATAEGVARQAVEGMAKPVYAMDATGKKVLMSQTDALKAGSKVILPVNEKQVGDDIMLNNRLGDVRQKIAQYEQVMQNDLSSSDKGNIAGLLGTKGLKLGAFGTELPLDRVNAALSEENLKGLSSQGRDALIAYRNAREAMLGYQKVLNGSSRSSDKVYEINDQTLPDPSISDKDFTARSIRAFKQNLHVVGQGLPTIPGVKSPDEIEQEATAPAPTTPKSYKDQFPVH